MTGTTRLARLHLPFFEALARTARIGTGRVRLSISPRHVAPEARYETIRMPDLSSDPVIYARSFLHELQHVRDVLDGVGHWTREEMELRARHAENSVVASVIESIAHRHLHVLGRTE